MGRPVGSNTTESFSLTSSGVFSISDSLGHSFGLSVSTPESGVETSTLMGNGTTAVQETKVTAGSTRLADIVLTFSVYEQFCFSAGVRLVISGSENGGILRITFDKRPISFSTDRAWFGNSSGYALGFDWSDSKSLNPSFNATANALTYSVGSTFTIDPVTISTSTSSNALGCISTVCQEAGPKTYIGGSARRISFAWFCFRTEPHIYIARKHIGCDLFPYNPKPYAQRGNRLVLGGRRNPSPYTRGFLPDSLSSPHVIG